MNLILKELKNYLDNLDINSEMRLNNLIWCYINKPEWIIKMLDFSPESDKIDVADKKCYVDKIKKQNRRV